MSFVNLKGSDLWSEADITNRVHALIRSRYSEQDELKAARLSRKTESTEAELAFVNAVDTWIADCIEEGRQARIETVVLAQALQLEAAQARLTQYRLAGGKPAVTEEKPTIGEDGNSSVELVEIFPAVEPITEFILDEEGNPTEEPNPDWERVLIDDAERLAAQSIIDGATAEAVSLVEYRKAVEGA